jgi:hypothetical protein
MVGALAPAAVLKGHGFSAVPFPQQNEFGFSR